MARHTRSPALLSVAVALFAFVFLAEAAFQKGHVHLPFTRVGKRPSLSNRDTDDTSAIVPIGNNLLAYAVNVQVGTPPQDMTLAITTTGGLSWLQSADSSVCQPYQEYRYPDDDFSADPILITVPSRCTLGSYNESHSSTHLDPNQQYEYLALNVFPGIGVYGKNMTDTLVLGDLVFPDMPLGLVTRGHEHFAGVLGLGYDDTSVRYDLDGIYNSDINHPRFMDRIVADGHANTRAFSIWLDDPEGNSGHLLFGAIDKGSYEGELLSMQARNEYRYQQTFGISVDAFEAASDADSELEPVSSNDFPLGVTISPGELVSRMPKAVFNKIASLTGATHDSSLGFATISCDAAKTNNARFAFRLAGPDGPVINFETADLILPHDVYMQNEIYDERPEDICVFGLVSADYYHNLGSSLLRRTYLVFDLENELVAAAPVKFRSKGEDAPTPTIVAFASSGAPIPSASLYCGDSVCQDYCEGEHCPGSWPTPTEDPRYDYPGGDDYDSGGDSTPSSGEAAHWRTVAIGVGVSLGVTALIAGIAITIIWGRICRRSSEPTGKEDDEDWGSEGPVPVGGPVMSQPAARGMRMQSQPVMLSPGTLPVIKEEDLSSRAPQLPVVPAAGSITPPEPLTPPNRNSMAVSAVSSDDGPLREPSPEVTTGPEPGPPKSPKGKTAENTEDHKA